jgi:hypothetical protein
MEWVRYARIDEDEVVEAIKGIERPGFFSRGREYAVEYQLLPQGVRPGEGEPLFVYRDAGTGATGRAD